MDWAPYLTQTLARVDVPEIRRQSAEDSTSCPVRRTVGVVDPSVSKADLELLCPWLLSRRLVAGILCGFAQHWHIDTEFLCRILFKQGVHVFWGGV